MTEMDQTGIYNLLRTEPYNTQFKAWRQYTYGSDLPADQGNAAWFYSNGYRTVEAIDKWFASVGFPVTGTPTCIEEGYIKYGTDTPCCEGLEPVWDETVHPTWGGEYVCKKTTTIPPPGGGGEEPASGTTSIIMAAGIIIVLSILYSMFAKR